MNSFPTLHTERCTLSEITQCDIPVLRQILDDAETKRFLPELCEEFSTTESLQQFIASFDKYLFHDEGILWGIRKEDMLIGFIAIMDISSNPTLFYAMHPDCRNQGCAKESVSGVIKHIKVIFPNLKLKTEVYNDNQASISILQSCGFKVDRVNFPNLQISDGVEYMTK